MAEQEPKVPVPVDKAEAEKRDLLEEVRHEAKKRFPGLTDEEIDNFL